MFFSFPSKFVFTTRVDSCEEINKDIISIINTEELKRSTSGSNLTSYFNESGSIYSFLKEKQYLKKIIWNPMDEMFNSIIPLSSNPKVSSIDHAWLNIYEPGDIHHAHSHSGTSSFSVIYIVKLEGENTTWFHQDGPPGFEYLYCAKDAQEGDVLIFPSNLVHYVSPSLHSRITIAFNISSSF